MNDFDFVQAKNEGEALEKLTKTKTGTATAAVVPLAGGTNLMVNMKRAPLDAELVVDLSRIESLQSIAGENGTVSLGSGVTFADLLEWRPGGAFEALMRPMAAAFAGPLIRNLATLGGNICDASPAADLSPPLLALDAKVKLERSGGGSRVLPLEEFFQGVRRTARGPDELLTSIELPRPDPADQAFYYKLGKRKADAISIVSIAILLRRKSDKVEHVRIALGAVAPVAMRAHEAEAELLGNELTGHTITAAAAAAAAEVSPIDDFRATADYRRQMVDVLVRRGLEQIAVEC
jgi:CO/xanthine dehydrogenase FAD-binding subunit